MSFEAVIFPGLTILCIWFFTENMYSTFSCPCRENEAILPRSPSDTIDRITKQLFENQILPVAVLVSAPHLDFIVVTTRCNDRFELWVCPGDLPHWPIVCLESLSMLLCAIGFHLSDLNESVAVTSGNLRSVEVVLTIVDVLFVLCFKRGDFSLILHFFYSRHNIKF